MGNSSSKEKESFGSINHKEGGKHRPGYYISKKKLIYDCKEIPLLPGENYFKKLKYSYLKTNLRVFYKGKQILADPNTFQVLNRNQITDTDLKKLDSVIGTDTVNGTKKYYYKGKYIK